MKSSPIDYHGTGIRLVASIHYSIMIPAFALINDGLNEWRYLTTPAGLPATWTQIISNYHSTINLVFILMAAYLIAVVALVVLIGHSWTSRGGFDKTSYRNILERVLYTIYLALSIVVVWLLSQWGFFAFTV